MLKGAIIGTGFWSRFQIAAWKELEGVQITALYNRTVSKAEALAKEFKIGRVYTKVEELLAGEELDFVDIITDVHTHALFARLAAEHQINVICQKPMAATLEDARNMVDVCRQQKVKLFIHENFRWQAPVRAIQEILASGIIGTPFKARVSFCSAFPVYENQPFLKELEHFILTDIGSHILDVCRYLFGEAKTLYCITQRVNKDIKGEDVANVLMQMESGLHCFAEMSYASILEKESFPQTLILVEGEKGSVRLGHDFEIKISTTEGTRSRIIQPKLYDWVDPAYAVAHSSIVDCCRDILNGLQGGRAETTGDDNFRTVQLLWAAYASAETGKTIFF
jgi:predicted dehydrogenase